MRRQRKTPEEHAREIANIVLSPHSYVYTERDAYEERLVTTLLLAGEALAKQLGAEEHGSGGAGKEEATPFASPEANGRPALFEDLDELSNLLRRLEAWIDEDARRADLLARLPGYFGDGEVLRLAFRNVFRQPCASKTLDADGQPILTDREVDVLREAAGDRPHEEIASRLGIACRTVDRHFENIYTKLRVQRPMQAVARALAMGYLDMDALDFVYALSHGSYGHFGLINYLINCGSGNINACSPIPKSLFSLGLLIIALSGTTALAERDAIAAGLRQPGFVYALNAQGIVVCAFPYPLYLNRGFAVAPATAVAHGFTPDHMYIASPCRDPAGLNPVCVEDYTPDGRFVRSFCGGRDIAHRLCSGHGMVFTSDGRLLVTSGGMTDAILAFSQAGAKVSRFAAGCFENLCCDRAGNIYASQMSGLGGVIKVFAPDGQLIRTVGGTPAGSVYTALAVNSSGQIFTGVPEGDRSSIVQYDPDGVLLRIHRIPGFSTTHFAFDAHDRLYIPCEKKGVVSILLPDGAVRVFANLPGRIIPYGVAPGTGGILWIYGGIP